ncbi:MAG: hypothetical protein AAGC85_00035 [Bacteroidota bacterium]
MLQIEMERVTEFNEEELNLLTDKALMPLKQRISQKLEDMLSELHTQLNINSLDSKYDLPESIFTQGPKISKGENYQTYSYRVLDFPRHIQQGDIFLFRSLALWGHHFSFHLILSGSYLEKYGKKLYTFSKSYPAGFYWVTDETPWDWIYQPQTYTPLNKMGKDEIEKAVHEQSFVKVTCFLPLESYKKMQKTGLQSWQFWQRVLFDKK